MRSNSYSTLLLRGFEHQGESCLGCKTPFEVGLKRNGYFNIVPLAPELAMSVFAYDPFGTETIYFCILVLCQMDHK